MLCDTLGGLFSPAIGIVSILYIYKTFVAQREQLEDQKRANDAMIATQNEQLEDQKKINDAQHKQLEEQREQYHVSRITDILYSQLNRVDESVKSASFNLFDPSRREVQGHDGLYSFNEFTKEENKKLKRNPDDL